MTRPRRRSASECAPSAKAHVLPPEHLVDEVLRLLEAPSRMPAHVERRLENVDHAEHPYLRRCPEDGLGKRRSQENDLRISRIACLQMPCAQGLRRVLDVHLARREGGVEDIELPAGGEARDRPAQASGVGEQVPQAVRLEARSRVQHLEAGVLDVVEPAAHELGAAHEGERAGPPLDEVLGLEGLEEPVRSHARNGAFLLELLHRRHPGAGAAPEGRLHVGEEQHLEDPRVQIGEERWLRERGARRGSGRRALRSERFQNGASRKKAPRSSIQAPPHVGGVLLAKSPSASAAPAVARGTRMTATLPPWAAAVLIWSALVASLPIKSSWRVELMCLTWTAIVDLPERFTRRSAPGSGPLGRVTLAPGRCVRRALMRSSSASRPVVTVHTMPSVRTVVKVLGELAGSACIPWNRTHVEPEDRARRGLAGEAAARAPVPLPNCLHEFFSRDPRRPRRGRPLRLVSARCAPRHLRSDNGPEFVSKALLQWMTKENFETAFIDPGKPWQNGTNESFNGRFRDESSA